MAKKVTRIIHTGLYKPQEEIAKRIEEDGLSLAEIIRNSLTAYGKEHYPEDPGYVEIQKKKLALKEKEVKEKEDWDKMDPVDYVKNTLMGEVDEKNGVALFINPFGGTNDYDLSEIKSLSKDHYIIDAHMGIINGTHKHDNGLDVRAWTKEQCEEFVKKWRAEVREKLESV